jgi:hypothetical protein
MPEATIRIKKDYALTTAFGERAIFLRFAPEEVYRCAGPGRLWVSSASGTSIICPFRCFILPHFVVPVFPMWLSSSEFV